MEKKIAVILLIVLGVSTNAQNNGLITYYPLDGDANDDSGNGHHGIVNGATLTVDRFDNENSAYSFDGEDDYIAVNKSIITPDLAGFSIAAWIKSNGQQNTFAVPLSQGAAGYQGIAFQYGWPNPSDFICIAGPKSGDWRALQFNTDLETDLDWHFYTATYDGTTFISYKDSQKQFQENSSLDLGSSDFTIGQDSENSDRFFNGSIDEVRIYNYALTDNEIINLYDYNTSTSTINNSLLEIYPNPAHNHIYIKGISINSVISVYSITGKLLKIIPTTSAELVINISDLENGVYLLKLSTEKETYFEKVIKE